MAAKATAGAEETVAAAPEAELCVYGGEASCVGKKASKKPQKASPEDHPQGWGWRSCGSGPSHPVVGAPRDSHGALGSNLSNV